MSFPRSQINEALDWRYATKKYDSSKKVSNEDWATILKSLHFSPSSYGLQPWQFLVIENPKVREELKPFSWNQTAITESSHLVVLTTRAKITSEYIDNYIKNIADVRQVNSESLTGYRDIMIKNIVEGMTADQVRAWNQRQAYIAMGFALETAALLKIDSTPIEGFEPKEYDRILDLNKTDYRTVAAISFGYRHSDDKHQNAKKVRFSTEDIIKTI